ncbi:MAG: urease accessory protein UreF [Rhodoferax sp.]|nr:urease accessory protein UreF [Rhodoferax sp.]
MAAATAEAEPARTSDLVRLMWLASPALPIGGFSYSEGLEAAIDRDGLRTPAAVSAWLQDQLQLTLARSDLALVAQAVRAWRARDLNRVLALNDWVLQTRESSELRLQTEQMGRSMMDWLRNQHTGDDSDPAHLAADADVSALSRHCESPTYPVAFALAASITGAPVADCLSSYAFGWAENMVQAAVKAVPLGQNAGQRILADLAKHITRAVSDALARDDDSRQAFAPMLAILSAQHETQYSRLFRS